MHHSHDPIAIYWSLVGSALANNFVENKVDAEERDHLQQHLHVVGFIRKIHAVVESHRVCAFFSQQQHEFQHLP